MSRPGIGPSHTWRNNVNIRCTGSPGEYRGVIKTKSVACACIFAGSVVLLSFSAHGAGFVLQEQSVKGSGRAFSGEVAMADDVSVMFYNPAGMTRLEGVELQAGVYAINPKARLTNDGSGMTVGPFPEMPVGGLESDQGFSTQPAGYFYAATPVTNDFHVGVAVTVPFGLKNDYETDYFGRYDSTKSKVLAVDIAPSIAYRVNDRLSIGGAINFQRAEATLVNALPNPLAPGGPSPESDGVFTVDGSDWSIGFTAGILFQASDQLRIGASYRSAMSHRLTGDATTEFGGTTMAQDVAADLDLPDMASVGFAYDLTPALTFLSQFNYYGWNRFEEVRLEFADNSEMATTEDFKDSWGVAVGAEVKTNDVWNIRAGIAYDRTPTRDEFRSTRIPDANRIWLSVGATWNVTEHAALDLSYAHMLAKSAPINRINDFAQLATSVSTQGETRTSSHVLGLNLRGRF